MSRKLINEEIRDFGNQFVKGMDSLTIMDPGKLRVPYGGGGKTPRKQSWMTVSMPAGFNVEVDQSQAPYHDNGGARAAPSQSGHGCASSCQRESSNKLLSNHHSNLQSNVQDVVMDISRQSSIKLSLEPLIHANPNHVLSGRQGSEHTWEIKGWTLSVGYTIFGLALAFCNLVSSAYTSQVCTAMSPIPMACLFLQALFCMDQGSVHGAYKRSTTAPGVWCLVVSALLIPTACVSWNVYFSVSLILALSLSVVACQKYRGIFLWACLSGLCLALVVATPTPAVIFPDPKWGMTVALFFLGVLCFLGCVGLGVMELKIRYL